LFATRRLKTSFANAERDFFKPWVISDLHGFYVDKKAFSCVLQAMSENPVDVLYINGDLLDLPWLMSEGKHKFSAEEDHVTVDEEIDFTVDHILKPLRKVLGKKVPIIFKPGNHEDRLLRMNASNTIGLREIVTAGLKRDRMKLTSMLRFDDLGITLDRGEKKQGRDTDTTFLRKRGDRGALIHGYLTAQNRLKKYLDTYLCSGTSGHTHAMKRETKPWYGGEFVWQESGCLCRMVNVEYLPIGKDTTWTHGFVTIWVNKYDGQLFVKGHEIKDYTLEFKGQIYEPVAYA
jgi:predicted phosphodiesterase